MNVKITTESASDLSREQLDFYGIETVPAFIHIGEKTFRDGIDIDSYKLFEEMEKPDVKVTTAGVSEYDCHTLFSKLVAEGYDVVHFSISSRSSVGYRNASEAAKSFPNVYVVDTQNVSAGMSLLILKAQEMAAQGISAKAIYEELRTQTDLIETTCVLDTLQYVRRGGRISSVVAIGADLLNLKPMVWVREGKLSVGKKYRGKLEKVIHQYVHDRLAGRKDIDLRRVFIIDTLLNKSILSGIRDLVKTLQPFQEILSSDAGCGISSHAGPNVLGIVFMRTRS